MKKISSTLIMFLLCVTTVKYHFTGKIGDNQELNNCSIRY